MSDGSDHQADGNLEEILTAIGGREHGCGLVAALALLGASCANAPIDHLLDVERATLAANHAALFDETRAARLRTDLTAREKLALKKFSAAAIVGIRVDELWSALKEYEAGCVRAALSCPESKARLLIAEKDAGLKGDYAFDSVYRDVERLRGEADRDTEEGLNILHGR